VPNYGATPKSIEMLFEQGSDRDVPSFEPMDRRYPLLNLGAGKKKITGTLPLDWPDWDAETDPIPYPDASVGGIIAYHFLEHLRDPRPVLRECSRVLISGAPLNIVVPHYLGTIAYQDLDHKTFWTSETFRTLIDNPYYEKDHDGFAFWIGVNMIMGMSERNLMLVTQLIKI
jgi:SAM-dependent methyltransferase